MNRYSVFEYLYRDGGNNKAFSSLLLEGDYSDSLRDEVELYLNDGLWFIAEQLGIPSLFSELWPHSNGPNDNDLPFHEFCTLRQARNGDIVDLPLWGSPTDLLQKLKAVNQRWDIFQSARSSY